jgi:hypothetical protein
MIKFHESGWPTAKPIQDHPYTTLHHQHPSTIHILFLSTAGDLTFKTAEDSSHWLGELALNIIKTYQISVQVFPCFRESVMISNETLCLFWSICSAKAPVSVKVMVLQLRRIV